MEDTEEDGMDLSSCNLRFLSIFAIVVLGIVVLIVGRKYLRKVPGLITVFGKLIPRPHPVMVLLHREVAELRRATLQIAKDWAEMTDLMTIVKEQQCSFVRRLDGDFEAMGECLHKSLQASLEEECLRNDQRFTKINKIVDGFRDEFQNLKEIFLRHKELLEKEQVRKQMVDGWTQTGREMVLKKKSREGHLKILDEICGEQESSKPVISIIKKALAEFLKEAKRQLALEKEEMMDNMKLIFSRLVDDREDIKNSIASAFSTSTHQNQKTFEQFGCVGRDAMKCLAMLSEKSEKIASARFQESVEKLREISELLRDLNFNVVSIKTTLDNIDGQFDDIYQKLEFGNQKNMENYEDVANTLKTAAEEWDKKYSNLEEITGQLTEVTERIKDLLPNFNKDFASETSTDMIMQPYSQTLLTPSSSLTPLDDTRSEGMAALLEEFPVFDELLTLLRTCFIKMQFLKNVVEQGTDKINQSIENLLKNVQFLSESVETSVHKLKNLNVDLPEGVNSKEFNQELKEFIRDIVSLNSKGDESPPFKMHESVMDERPPWQPRDSNEYPNVLGIIDNNLKSVLKGKNIREISKKSEYQTPPDNTRQTSVMTARGHCDDVQKRLKD